MSYDSPTLAALEANSLVIREFLVVVGKTLGGSEKVFAYWTGEDNVAQNVTNLSGATVSRSFLGGGTLLEVPDMVDTIGIEARGLSLGLDHISVALNSPMDMVFGNNVRVARVELYRGLFNPDTWSLVSEPHRIFAGRVDGASVTDAAAGGEGSLQLDIMPSSIDLTKINPAMESDEQQRRRDGDRFRRYGDTAGQVEVWWGQAKS